MPTTAAASATSLCHGPDAGNHDDYHYDSLGYYYDIVIISVLIDVYSREAMAELTIIDTRSRPQDNYYLLSCPSFENCSISYKTEEYRESKK